MTLDPLRRAWRNPYWVRPVLAIAGLLFAVSAAASVALNYQYLEDRVEAFDGQQNEVIALRAELDCRAVEATPATRLQGEIIREGMRAMAIWAVTGNSDDPRIAQAAVDVNELYRLLGPALEERERSTETCDRSAVDDDEQLPTSGS